MPQEYPGFSGFGPPTLETVTGLKRVEYSCRHEFLCNRPLEHVFEPAGTLIDVVSTPAFVHHPITNGPQRLGAKLGRNRVAIQRL